jgi:hypothetical protein
MSLIQFVATGGTIASRSTAAGRQAQATGAELLSRSTIPRGTDVRVADLGPAELPKVDVVPLYVGLTRPGCGRASKPTPVAW